MGRKSQSQSFGTGLTHTLTHTRLFKPIEFIPNSLRWLYQNFIIYPTINGSFTVIIYPIQENKKCRLIFEWLYVFVWVTKKGEEVGLDMLLFVSLFFTQDYIHQYQVRKT